MRTCTTFLVGLAALTLSGAAMAEDKGCLFCHTDETMTERGRRPAQLFENDAHDKAGVGCSDCHGGNGAETDFLRSHDKKLGFRGKIRNPDTPEVCGGCHDDAAKLRTFGVAEPETGQGKHFRETVHGKLRPVEGFEAPNCASCHGAHGILSPEDPESNVHPKNVPETCNRCHGDLAYMRAFTSARVRVDQLIEYRTSIHGQLLEKGDVKVAVCSSCHSSHDILPATDLGSTVHPLNVAKTCGRCHSDPEYMKGYTIADGKGEESPIPTSQLDRYGESVHHEAMVDRGDLSAPTCNDCHGNHGATPPEVRAVATVCAQCHSRPAELFSASKLKKELDGLGFKECATCHGHHEIRAPGDALLEAIANGETPSGWVPDEKSRETLKGFLADISELESSIREIQASVVKAENYGMDLTRARLKLNQATDQLIRARVSIHTFDPAEMDLVVRGNEDEDGGLTFAAEAAALAEDAFEERAFRRKGLAVALAILAVLIVALVTKIRQMESRRE